LFITTNQYSLKKIPSGRIFLSDVLYAFGFDDTSGNTPQARHEFRTVPSGAYPAAVII
jgi:hypothetical protein